MNSKFKNISLFLAITFSLSSMAFAVVVPVTSNTSTRLYTANTSNNGTDAGLIGVNTNGVDNLFVGAFDLSSLSGSTVNGATITKGVLGTWTNAQHGTADDTIVLSELAVGNAGWTTGGTGAVTNAGGYLGTLSWAFQSTTGLGAGTQFVDAGGNSVSDITGALTQVGTAPGWDSGAGPAALTFTVSAATAQGWIDNGLAGLVFGATEGPAADVTGRFNMPPSSGVFQIDFDVVPEPSAVALFFGALLPLMMLLRKRR